jgi:hypothetical protein
VVLNQVRPLEEISDETRAQYIMDYDDELQSGFQPRAVRKLFGRKSAKAKSINATTITGRLRTLKKIHRAN